MKHIVSGHSDTACNVISDTMQAAPFTADFGQGPVTVHPGAALNLGTMMSDTGNELGFLVISANCACCAVSRTLATEDLRRMGEAAIRIADDIEAKASATASAVIARARGR
jgi:hypothetical protein